MKGDAYRALCLYAERHGMRVRLETVKSRDRQSELSRISVWKCECAPFGQRVYLEVGGAKIVGDPDHAAESLLRWFAHEEQAA